jgi:trimethylamine---corrinoid protein Co-methyltransferase
LSSTANYECWLKQGGRDTAAHAAEICAKTLAECQQPPMDNAIRAELGEFVIRC